MYLQFKQIIRSLLPQKLLFFFEPILRKLLYLIFYRGTTCSCTICGKSFSGFIPLENGELICPNCGSLGRSRRLFDILKDEGLQGKRILEFSPSRAMYRRMKKDFKSHYVATDYANEFIADKSLDITSIDEPAESYDIIICYHILEHIQEDQEAIKELHRIVNPGGRIFIQTPFKEGEIYENPAVKTPEERLIHFGQEDHVRIYSVEGLKARLEKEGFRVRPLTFNVRRENRYGFKEQETVLVAYK